MFTPAQLSPVLENCVDDSYASLLHSHVKKLPFHFEENVNRVTLKENPTAKVLHGIDSDIIAISQYSSAASMVTAKNARTCSCI